MIFTIGINILLFLLTGFMSLLPTGGEMPEVITSGIKSLWYFIRSWDFILPVDAIKTCLAIATLWFTFRLIWGIVIWIIKKIPFLMME